MEKKRALFADLDLLVSEKTILASSTSSMPASTFSESLSHRSQVIVAHPVRWHLFQSNSLLIDAYTVIARAFDVCFYALH